MPIAGYWYCVLELVLAANLMTEPTFVFLVRDIVLDRPVAIRLPLPHDILATA